MSNEISISSAMMQLYYGKMHCSKMEYDKSYALLQEFMKTLKAKTANYDCITS